MPQVLLTLRRFGLQVEGGEEQYVASCYHALRYPQVRESQQQGIPVQQRGRLNAQSQKLTFFKKGN